MIDRRIPMLVAVPLLTLTLAACGGSGGDEASPDGTSWTSSPGKVVEGLMYAYSARDDSLYASLLAEDFQYHFEPVGADSTEILGWGKEEDLVATGNLFHTADVESLALVLEVGDPAPASRGDGWMVVPISGGRLEVRMRDKEAMEVDLNRQEIYVRPVPGGGGRWEVIAWHDYPNPES